ncbi:MAG: hypothetical protein WD688_18260 [Candidatus Binatia bacterium]
MVTISSTGSQDFAARQARNGWISAVIVLCFLLFFCLVGLSVDYVYFDAFTIHGPPIPIATLMALSFSAVVTFTAYTQGGTLILASVAAENLDIEIPEHRELHNIVTEMALASGC